MRSWRSILALLVAALGAGMPAVSLAQEKDRSPAGREPGGSSARVTVILRSEAGEPVRGATVVFERPRPSVEPASSVLLEAVEGEAGTYATAVEPRSTNSSAWAMTEGFRTFTSLSRCCARA